jgi:hypothetical protein
MRSPFRTRTGLSKAVQRPSIQRLITAASYLAIDAAL